MKATKIRMKAGCGTSQNLLEIDSIYITGCKDEGFYKKENLHEYLLKNPGTIQVNISPYPNVIPATLREEKYVRSTPNVLLKDNLLCLPKE